MVVQVGVVERGHAKEGKGEGDGDRNFPDQKIRRFGGSNRTHGSRTPDGHHRKNISRELQRQLLSTPYN